jgi:hypothetical protein
MNNKTMETLVSLAAEMGAEELLQDVQEDLGGQLKTYLPRVAFLDVFPYDHGAPIFTVATKSPEVYSEDVLAVAVWEWEGVTTRTKTTRYGVLDYDHTYKAVRMLDERLRQEGLKLVSAENEAFESDVAQMRIAVLAGITITRED